MTDINTTLQERETRYGDYMDNATIAQNIKFEPVAWMHPTNSVAVSVNARHANVGTSDWIPLYKSPQTKPLSDDDIEEFEWMLKKYFNYKPDAPAPNLNRIIRAIEAKVRGQ